MSQRIKKLKVKINESEFSQHIPLGADAINIDLNNGKNLEEELQDINGDILQVQQDLSDTLDTVNQNLADALDTVDQNIEDLNTEVDTKISNFTTETNTKLDNFSTEINQKIDTFSDDITQQIQDFNDKVEQDFQDFDEHVNQELTTAINTVNTNLDALETKVNNTLDTTVAQVNADLAEVNQQIDDLETTVNTTISTAIADINETIEEMDEANNERFEQIEENMQKLIKYKTVTLLASNWTQNATTRYFENEYLDEDIPAGALIEGYLDLSNQSRMLNGYIESFEGGFKVITTALPTRDIEMNISIQVVSTEAVKLVGALNLIGLGWLTS